jgi:hypothetical protein
MPRTPTAAERWRGVIDDFRRSGLEQAEFCRRRGVSLHTFRKYLYGSRLSPEAVSPPAKFLPVAMPTVDVETERPAADPIVLILPRGRRVAVGPGFDAQTLRRLLDALDNGA